MKIEKKVYVCGSLNMDLSATVAHSPKVGETILSSTFLRSCGGKGANQAIASSKLGASVSMIGKVGTDDYGKQMIQNLQKYDVDCQSVFFSELEASGIAMITVVGGNNTIVVAQNANCALMTKDIDAGLKNAVDGDILVVQLESPFDTIEYALKIAKKKGMTTILNPAPASNDIINILKYTDIVVPNETEIEIITKVNPVDIVHCALAVKEFYRFGVKKVVITLGERGAIVADGYTIDEIDAIKVDVVDTTSAGDTFIGAIACGLSKGKSLLDSCKFGNVASSITVSRVGASISIPTLKEVEDKIAQMKNKNMAAVK